MLQIAAALEEPLDDLPSDSDISGVDDSDMDESWLPVWDRNLPSSDVDHDDDDSDVEPVCGDGDHDNDNELPDLDQSEISRLVVLPQRGLPGSG